MSDDRQNAIRVRAHQLWEEGGHEHGRHDDHWSQAEREVDSAQNGGSTIGTSPSESDEMNESRATPGPASPGSKGEA